MKGIIYTGSYPEGAIVIEEKDYALASLREICQRLLVGESFIYAVNFRKVRTDYWNVFLKVLESDSDGEIWFYGSPLWVYPKTIESRCSVVKTVDKEFLVRLEESKLGKEKHFITVLYQKKNWEFDFCINLAKNKELFLTYLAVLDQAKATDYSLVWKYASTMNRECVILFELWLNGFEGFSEEELKLCLFLKQKLDWESPIVKHGLETLFFIYLFLCKAQMVR